MMANDEEIEKLLKECFKNLESSKYLNPKNIRFTSYDEEINSILNQLFYSLRTKDEHGYFVIENIDLILQDLINKEFYNTVIYLWTKLEDKGKTYDIFKQLENKAKELGRFYLLIKHTPNDILGRFINDLKNEENIHIRKEKIEELYKYSQDDFRIAYFKEVYELVVGETLDIEVEKKIENANKTKLNPYFVFLYGKICTEEQLYRLAMDSDIQSYMIKLSENKLIFNSLIYVLKNDDNWIISLNNILEHLEEKEFEKLIDSTQEIQDDKINDEATQLFVAVISDTNNYFGINTYDDLTNYEDIKTQFCMKILNNESVDIPRALKNYTEEELYKFALLEYKFGISLEYARVLLQRYGEDIKEFPEGILKEYLLLLSEIVHCDDIKIKGIVALAIKNNKLNEPWEGYPNTREAEGKILNLFAELYNQTLYKPNEDDKEEYTESYIDQDGKQYNIDVYKIKKDFRMCARTEIAFADKEQEFFDRYGEIIDYKKYYIRDDIIYHINSESYIGNDSISLLDSDEIIVGYEKIYYNQLGGASPRVSTSNRSKGITTSSLGEEFSIYGADNIEFRVPDQMINNTRIRESYIDRPYININEIYKDRLFVNESGKVEQYKPSYVVWIEEDTEEKRRNPEWKINREKDRKWLKTKKAAAQLGVPIVIIDREYFAKREMKKTELMKKLINGEKINESEYSEFLIDSKNYTKPEIIKKIFTKIENNRTGLINNDEMKKVYFTSKYRIEIRDAIFDAISKMDEQDARECLNAIIEVAQKEMSFESEVLVENIVFYTEMMGKAESKLADLVDKKQENPLELNTNISTKDLCKLYVLFGISPENIERVTREDETSNPMEVKK